MSSFAIAVRWKKIQVGMQMHRVYAILDEPTSSTIKDGSEIWNYEGIGLIVFKGTTVIEIRSLDTEYPNGPSSSQSTSSDKQNASSRLDNNDIENYYSILGTSEKASKAEIRQAYRILALRWHPDTNRQDPNAEEVFKRISHSYHVLSNEARRKEYDQALRDGSTREPTDKAWEETAEHIFFQEMLRMAYELTLRNVRLNKIAAELIKQGCPKAIAYKIADKVQSERKKLVRSGSKRLLVRSVIFLVAGILLIAIFSSQVSFIAYIGVLSVIYGIINIIRALFFLSSGRMPRK
jgi:DnaJ-domain-containing protein 1